MWRADLGEGSPRRLAPAAGQDRLAADSIARPAPLRHHAPALARRSPPHHQDLLGHSTIGLTLDVYGHTLPNLQKKAADQMDALLGDAR
jgi:integrase